MIWSNSIHVLTLCLQIVWSPVKSYSILKVREKRVRMEGGSFEDPLVCSDMPLEFPNPGSGKKNCQQQSYFVAHIQNRIKESPCLCILWLVIQLSRSSLIFSSHVTKLRVFILLELSSKLLILRRNGNHMYIMLTIM